MADRERFNLNLENNDESFDLNPDQGDEDFIVDFGEVINTGAVTSYNELTNKPSINNVELRGDKTSQDLGLADDDDITNLQEQIDAITVSSDVVDVLGTYQDLLDYDTSELGDNDIVKVLQDSTHGNAMSYYRWNKTAGQWVYVGSEGPFYTKSESDTKFQDKLVSGTNIKTINNESILGSGNIDIEGGYPEVPEKLYEYTNLYDLFNEGVYIDDGIYTVSQEWYCEIAKPNEEWTSDVINPNSILYIYRPYGFISWTGPTSSMYWSNGDETFTGGVLTTIDDVNYAIDERIGSNVVMTNTDQTISGKKTFTSNNGTVFENAGGLILKYLSSSPELKIIPDNNGNFDIYYQNTQLARIDSNYITLHRGFRPSRNETLDLGSSSYNWNKIYSKTLANGSIEKNVVNLLTNDADLVPTYGNSFSIGSSSRLWNTLFALALHNGTTRIAISDIATKTELAGKQDTLTAGTGIAITNNVISSTLEGIDYEVDQELPQTGEKGIIYLIPNGESETENIYDEYIWIPPLQEGDTGRFEFIGTTQTDLSNYVDLDTAQTITGRKSFNGNIDVSNEIKFSSAGYPGVIKYGNSNVLSFNSGGAVFSVIPRPSSNNSTNLGTSSYMWKDLYLSGNLSDGTNSVSVEKIANVDDVVDLSSAQTISGVKTFSNGIEVTNGYLRVPGNQFAFRYNNVNQYLLQTARFSPLGSQDLGSNTYQWKDLYLSGNLSDGTNETTVAKINNNFAPTYDNTSTYEVGDKRIYEGRLYKCNTEIDTAEDFDSTKWTEISVGSEYVDISSDQTITGKKTFSGNIAVESEIKFSSSGTIKRANSSIMTFDNNAILFYQTPRVSVDGQTSLGTATRRWNHLYLKGTLRDGNNNNYGLAIPDTTSYTANKTIATTDDITSAIGDIDTALQNLVSGGGVQ